MVLNSMREMTASSLRWAVGAFYVLVGTMMLIVPHQFASVAYDALRPNLGLWGIVLLLLGLSLLAVVVLGLPRPLEVTVHLSSGTALIVLASGFAVIGGWTAVVNFSALGLGTALAPFVVRRTEVGASPGARDLLSLSVGLGSAITGLAMLVLPRLFDAPVSDAFRPYLVPLGLGFLVGGLSTIYTQLWTRTPRVAVAGSQLVLGATLLAFCLISSVPLRAWIGIAYYGGFGLTMALLPWLGWRLGSLDPSSIQTRMALTLALVAGLPLVTAVTVISNQMQESATKETLLQQETLASTAAGGIADYLDVSRTAIAQIAAQPGLAQMPPAEQRLMLQNLDRIYPDALAFSTFDAGGNPIARSDDAPLTPAAGYPIFENVKRTGNMSSDILVSPVFHRLVFSFGAPILAPDGSFAGAVVVAMEPSKLSTILERADPGPGTEIALLDGKGRILGRSENPPVESLVDVSGQPPVAAMLAATPGGEGSLRYQGQGGEHLVGFGRLRNLDWGVIVDSQADSALDAVRSQRDVAFEILAVCLLVALAAGTFAANLLAHPLTVLARAADRFSRGDATVPMPESGVKEIGHLTAAFGDMREKLAARTIELERLLEENRRHAELLGMIYDTSPGGLAVVLGPEMRFIYANPAYRRISPHPELDPIGRTLDEIWPTGEGFQAVKVLGHVMGTGEPFDTQRYERRFPDDSDHFYSFHLRRFPWGEQDALLIVLWETTESEMARQAAEAAVKVRDEFISIAAHELKTPVTSLQGFAQLMQRELGKTGTVNPERLAKAMERIEQQSKRLTKLNDQLLNLSRLQSGKLALQRQEVNLSALAASVIADMRHSHPERIIDLRDGAPAVVHVDPLRLEQVLVNLLDNAIKFSPEDSPIDIDVRAVDPGWVEVAVRDRGIGIPEEKRDLVFERFYQAHPEKHYGGMGIGLFISLQIVEMHGGTITVEEPGDGGSRFVVRLPRHP